MTIIDTVSGGRMSLQAEHGATVTPSDTTVFSTPSTLYVGVSGDLNITTVGGETIVYSNVPVGFFPVICTQVKATSTTATSICRNW